MKYSPSSILAEFAWIITDLPSSKLLNSMISFNLNDRAMLNDNINANDAINTVDTFIEIAMIRNSGLSLFADCKRVCVQTDEKMIKGLDTVWFNCSSRSN